jgi:hypothetical protein
MKILIGLCGITILINALNGACLTESQLGSLGFTDVLTEAVDNTGDDAGCKSESKVCVDPATLKEQIKKNLKRCQGNRNKQMEKYGERIEKQGEKLKNIADKVTEKTEKGEYKNRDKFKRPPKEGRDQLVNKFKEKCSEDNCADLKQSFVNVAEYKDCFDAISTLMCGSYCGLLSDSGSENAIVDSTGAITGVKVSKENANDIFSKCANFFTTMCQMTNVQLVVQEMGEDGASIPAKKGKSAKIQKVCEQVPELDTCKDDYTKCSDQTQIDFVQSFVSIGKSCAPGEPDENFDQVEKDLDSVEQEATGSTTTSSARILAEFKERLLEEVTTDCGLQFSSDGYNAFQAGSESGIEVSEYSESVSIISSLLFFYIVNLLK